MITWIHYFKAIAIVRGISISKAQFTKRLPLMLHLYFYPYPWLIIFAIFNPSVPDTCIIHCSFVLIFFFFFTQMVPQVLSHQGVN